MMTKEELERLKKGSEMARDIMIGVLCVLASPILLIVFLAMLPREIYNDCKRRKREKERVAKKPEPPKKTDVLLFSKDCVPVLPYSSVSYVATKPDKQIESFFQKNKEWLTEWSEWYGFDIVEVDMKEVKNALDNPNYFALLEHGLLWRSWSSTEHDRYYYFELNPGTTEQLQKQLVKVAHDIFKKL